MDPATILIGLGVLVGSILASLAWMEFKKWWNSDPHRDVVLFMGCKQTGKSEALSALLGEKFNANRANSGTEIIKKKTRLDENGKAAGNKKLASIDSGGEDNNITNLIKASVKHLDEKRTEFFLLVLVFDLRKLGEDIIDGTASRLGQLACDIENKRGKGSGSENARKIYNAGHCGYAVIGTHSEQAGAITDPATLSKIAKAIGGYKRNFRCLNEGKIDCFELSKDKERGRLCIWLMNSLKALHD